MNDASEVDIDRIDRKILAILQTDGRISNLRLAEQVALSPTAVQARVARLTRDAYILGYEASESAEAGRGHDGVCRGAAGSHHSPCV